MDNNLQSLTIGAVAGAASVGVETIRFYQRKGLLDEPDRPPGGIRRYGARDVARVRFIKAAQRLGFSLDEVAGLLVLEDGAHCDEARTLAEAKLVAVREKLAGLRRIETCAAGDDQRMQAGQGQCLLPDDPGASAVGTQRVAGFAPQSALLEMPCSTRIGVVWRFSGRATLYRSAARR